MRKKEVIDEGFELFYNNLSHRRKFKRTIEIGIFGIIIFPVIYFVFGKFGIPFFRSLTGLIILEAVIIVIGVVQAVYEYIMWQKEKHLNINS